MCPRAALPHVHEGKAVTKQELMREYPKGCACPSSYLAWFDWAEAQVAHGLNQSRCPECGRWLFPQQVDGHPCTPQKE